MNNADRYLVSLAAEAAKNRPASEVEALIAETRAHLEDSIQARIELGATRLEAEQEALTAMGSVESLACDYGRPPLCDLRFMGAVLLTAATYALAAAITNPSALAAFVVFLLVLLSNAAYLVTSLCVRRFQAVPLSFLAMVGLACSLVPSSAAYAPLIGSGIAIYAALHALALPFRNRWKDEFAKSRRF